MRGLVRFFQRVLFMLLAGAALYGVIHCPMEGGVTLYVQNNLPLTRAVTPSVYGMQLPMPEAPVVPVEEPPAETPKAPPVRGDILGLMYHDFTDDPAKTSAWTTTGEKFRDDLLSLMEAGYRPLSVEAYITGQYDLGQDYFVVTFDDGYLSNLTVALPVLRELSVPATMFVITGSTELPNHLSWGEIALFNESDLISVYSHTDSHVRADSMPLASFLLDEAAAWDKLTKYIQPERKVLAYPNGAFTRASMEALAADGYEMFAVQHATDWYREDNAAGIRLLVRQNVSFDADVLALAAEHRSRAGLPSLAEANAIRAEFAAAEEAARLAYLRSVVDYDYERYHDERERPK